MCLQGGAEFSPACADMDAELVRRADGPVVVAPFACAPGREYALAGRHGAEHHRRVGAADVRVASDPSTDPAGALAAVAAAALLVLPGGSPDRLLRTLAGPFVDAVRAAPVVSGSSAGAMVLAGVLVLPGEDRVADGLGLVPGVAVVPHFRGPGPWVPRLLARGVHVLGVPESSGVVVDERGWTGAGAAATTVVGPDGERVLAVGETWAR